MRVAIAAATVLLTLAGTAIAGSLLRPGELIHNGVDNGVDNGEARGDIPTSVPSAAPLAVGQATIGIALQTIADTARSGLATGHLATSLVAPAGFGDRPVPRPSTSTTAVDGDGHWLVTAAPRSGGDYPLRRRNRMVFWHRVASTLGRPLAWIVAVPLAVLGIGVALLVVFRRRQRRRP
jgi:hypothetical protein